MSAPEELVGTIAAELRRMKETSKFCELQLPTVYGKPLDLYFGDLADRLESAVKRDIANNLRPLTLNDTSLRKEVVNVIRQMDNEITDLKHSKGFSHTVSALKWYRKKLKKGLKQEIRNFDLFDDWRDAADAWTNYEMCAGRRMNNGTCDGCNYSPARCVARWLYQRTDLFKKTAKERLRNVDAHFKMVEA